MKLIIFAIICAVLTGHFAYADTPPAPPPAPRISIFSTTTDWQALTGLPLNEYRGVFSPDSKYVGSRGIVLYYLDAFPCYGLGDGVRVWMGPNGKYDGELRIACVYAPDAIMFSYRNAARDADDARNTGMLTCPVAADGRTLNIDMSKCTRGKDWDEYR
jgi:hypothetical protein